MQIKEFKKLVFSEIKLLKDLPLIESNHSEASSPKFAINLIDVPGYETQLLPDLTGEVHLDVLLALHDHVFIFACFQYFLNRTPDPEGMNHYLEKLRSGEYNKPDIVSRIWISKEAKSIGKKLSSGKLVLCKSLLLQVPVFGSVLKYFSIVKNLPNLQRQINESHAQNMALQTHLQSYLRESFSIVSENSCSVIFVLDTLKQKVSSLETEVKNSKEVNTKLDYNSLRFQRRKTTKGAPRKEAMALSALNKKWGFNCICRACKRAFVKLASNSKPRRSRSRARRDHKRAWHPLTKLT